MIKFIRFHFNKNPIIGFLIDAFLSSRSLDLISMIGQLASAILDHFH